VPSGKLTGKAEREEREHKKRQGRQKKKRKKQKPIRAKRVFNTGLQDLSVAAFSMPEEDSVDLDSVDLDAVDVKKAELPRCALFLLEKTRCFGKRNCFCMASPPSGRVKTLDTVFVDSDVFCF
jgi:hypothetical protein